MKSQSKNKKVEEDQRESRKLSLNKKNEDYTPCHFGLIETKLKS